MSTLKRPAVKEVKDEDLSVNITAKWDRLEKEIIATGICEGLLLYYISNHVLAVKNKECHIEKNGSNDIIKLWNISFLLFKSCKPTTRIQQRGPATRVGDVLPKTEILKGFSKATTDTKTQKDRRFNEDELLRLIESKKVIYIFKSVAIYSAYFLSHIALCCCR